MSETTITSVQTSVDPSQGQIKQMISKVQNFVNEPSVQRSLPTLMAVIVCFVGLMAYLLLQKPSRTTLYNSLPEAEKMRVVDALKNAGVDVMLDPTTGEVMVPGGGRQKRLGDAASEHVGVTGAMGGDFGKHADHAHHCAKQAH